MSTETDGLDDVTPDQWSAAGIARLRGVHDADSAVDQEGGIHYRRLNPQPWDVVIAWESAGAIGHAEACAIEYLARWRSKGGIEDLRKARHWIEKLIEVQLKS